MAGAAAKEADPAKAELRNGIRQFNAREFYECHETLELLWRAERGTSREVYQGILQIGVGFHHLLRGNYPGAVALLDRGLRHLYGAGDRFMGVDVARLVQESEQVLTSVRALGPERLSEFDSFRLPVIHFAEP